MLLLDVREQPDDHQHCHECVHGVLPHFLGMSYPFDGTYGEQGGNERRPSAYADPGKEQEERSDGEDAGGGRHDANTEMRTLHILHRVQDERIEYRGGILAASILENGLDGASRIVRRHSLVI